MASGAVSGCTERICVPSGGRRGSAGQSWTPAGLEAGRLGIAAVAVGLAQGAPNDALAYAKQRETFGKPIIGHQGVAFLLADTEAAVDSARATVLAAARRKDAGPPYSRQASITKLIATEAAMRVTTDAVQVFGGASGLGRATALLHAGTAARRQPGQSGDRADIARIDDLA
ncbi:acyl-CoA dehydrogenase family protein [Streptomyces sp. bgisy027]|uniref:acyl-CoA dehydrogenase family protein n=1 Tax=Streptomyces sp. bgisy027 TaxID=3413770 RepID=UPI003D759915